MNNGATAAERSLTTARADAWRGTITAIVKELYTFLDNYVLLYNHQPRDAALANNRSLQAMTALHKVER